MAHHHKPECLVRKLYCSVQGQGHSEDSKCQWMIVLTIFSELLNLLLTNFVCCGIIMSLSVLWKDWFAVFKVKVAVKAHTIKMWLSTISSELHIFFATTLSLMVYHIISQIVLWTVWIAVVKITGKAQNVSICVNISWTATELGMVMRHGPGCHLKRLVCYLHGQGHNEGTELFQDPSATKFNRLVHHSKLDCLV